MLRTDDLARWDWEKGVCDIYIKRYPVCLAHGVRHCFEGHWHDAMPNGEDCYQ